MATTSNPSDVELDAADDRHGLIVPGPRPSEAGEEHFGERPTRRDLVVIAGLVVLLAFLWGRARGVWFWVDEGMAVGIASHPLSEIPTLLRQDGSPPLYYMLLHVWMSLFGSSEPSTHILSLIPALAAVPTALWAGWSLLGRRTGWALAALMALNPFIAYYANETRMYSLLVLLAMVSTAAFAHAFIFGRRRYLALFVVSLTALVYTHNWGLFYAAGAGLALVAHVLWTADDRRRVLIDGVVGFGAVGLLYAPWVPTLLYQVAHTGAPFSLRPTLERVRDDVVGVLGTPEAVVALGLGAGGALATLLRRPWSRSAMVVLAAAAIPTVAVAMGWLTSRDNSVWQARYLAVIVAPLLLVLAAGVARGGRAAVAAVVVYAAFAGPIAVKRLPTEKSDVKVAADEFGPRLRPGDVVVADFGRVPVLSYYLPAGLRFAEPTGPVADDRVSDQRNGTSRLRQTDPKVALAPLLDSLAEGGHALVVCPPKSWLAADDTEFVKLIFARCHETMDTLRADPRFRLDGHREPEFGLSTKHAPVVADLFTKVSPAR